ncbi:MAG: hypothetical protein HYS55_06600, partial [Candidatus Omnitrophica bacterium]|nr:hypothetical protein [Candidatus Omnitrophota bacterium]
MSDRLKNLLTTLHLLVVILFIFYPSLHYDFVEFDDNALVVRNPDIKVLEPARILELFRRSYITLYVPVTMFSYAVDYQIWHLTPFGFKFTNLVLHFLNTMLVFYLAKRLEKNYIFAFVIALIFAIHPVQIESVVWVAERKNVLSTFFLLLALMGYLKAVQSFSRQEERKWLFLSLLAYVAGLLSKPSTVVFVLLIAILNYFFLGGSFAFKRRFFFYFGLLVFAVLFTVITIVGTAGEVERYRYHGGSFWITFIIMMTIFWRYVGLLFFPYEQNILYSSPKYVSFSSPQVFISAIGIV